MNQLVLKPGDDTQLFAGTFGRGVQQYVFKAGSGTPPVIPVPIGTIGGAPNSGSAVGNAGRFGGGALGLPLLAGLLLIAARRRRLV